MATTNLKKRSDGYNYKYTELADINTYIESTGETYIQEIEVHENGDEYITTTRCKDGKILGTYHGCKVPQATLSGKSNPAQEYGSALTYARRYSLLMAYGLATEDDDAESLTQKSASTANSKASTARARSNRNEQTDAITAKIKAYADEHKMSMAEIAKDYHLNNATATAERLNEVYADLTSQPDFAAIDEPTPFD